MMILEHTPRDQARLILRRQGVLVELRAAAGRSGGRKFSASSGTRSPGKSAAAATSSRVRWTDDEVGAPGHRLRQRLRDALRAGVVDLHARTLGRRHLEVGGHEAIAHADGGGGRAARDRQQQRNVRPGCRRPAELRVRPAASALALRPQLTIARRLIGRGRHSYGLRQSQRLLRLAAAEQPAPQSSSVCSVACSVEKGPCLARARVPRPRCAARRGNRAPRAAANRCGRCRCSARRAPRRRRAAPACVARALERLGTIDRRRQPARCVRLGQPPALRRRAPEREASGRGGASVEEPLAGGQDACVAAILRGVRRDYSGQS